MTTADTDIYAVVRERYAALARATRPEPGCACGPSCCSDGSVDMIGAAYQVRLAERGEKPR